MTAPYEVPVRPKGGPGGPPPKKKPSLLIRHPDDSVSFITDHVRPLWDLLEVAVMYDRLDEDELDAAIALGILMRWPVSKLQRAKERFVESTGESAERSRQSRAWLNEVVMVTAAHPFTVEWSLDGQVITKSVTPGDTVPVTREYAKRLHQGARITRPNAVSASP